jgi:flagellar basal-body rod protein FlgB
MEGIHLFDLAERQAHWLSVRQRTVASNIANANTPGFKASDVVPFADTLQKTQLTMVATNPADLSGDASADPAVDVRPDRVQAESYSGNTVSLEQELVKAGDVNRDYSLNTNIVRAFQQMFLLAVKA